MNPNDGRVVSNFIVQAINGEDENIADSLDKVKSFFEENDINFMKFDMLNLDDYKIINIKTFNFIKIINVVILI